MPQPSRFRSAGAGGVWYGADSVHATCAEIAYWRFRFILDWFSRHLGGTAPAGDRA